MAAPFPVPQGGGSRSSEAVERKKSTMTVLYRVIVRVMALCTTAKLYRAAMTLVIVRNTFGAGSQQALQPSRGLAVRDSGSSPAGACGWCGGTVRGMKCEVRTSCKPCVTEGVQRLFLLLPLLGIHVVALGDALSQYLHPVTMLVFTCLP